MSLSVSKKIRLLTYCTLLLIELLCFVQGWVLSKQYPCLWSKRLDVNPFTHSVKFGAWRSSHLLLIEPTTTDRQMSSQTDKQTKRQALQRWKTKKASGGKPNILYSVSKSFNRCSEEKTAGENSIGSVEELTPHAIIFFYCNRQEPEAVIYIPPALRPRTVQYRAIIWDHTLASPNWGQSPTLLFVQRLRKEINVIIYSCLLSGWHLQQDG